MSCQKVIDDFLREYFEGKLSFRDLFLFRLHLAHCRQCRRYLDSYRKTIALTKVASAHSAQAESGDAPEELVKVILAARSRRD